MQISHPFSHLLYTSRVCLCSISKQNMCICHTPDVCMNEVEISYLDNSRKLQDYISPIWFKNKSKLEETFVFGKEELSCCWYRLPKINTYAFIFLVSVVTYIYDMLPPLKRWMIEFTFKVVRSCPRSGFWTSITIPILVEYDMMVIWITNMYVCYSEAVKHIIV